MGDLDSLPVWIVEATLYKDLNREAIQAAVAEAKKQPASLLVVFALTEVPTDRESLGFLVQREGGQLSRQL